MGKYSLKKRKGIRKQQSFKKRKGGVLGESIFGRKKSSEQQEQAKEQAKEQEKKKKEQAKMDKLLKDMGPNFQLSGRTDDYFIKEKIMRSLSSYLRMRMPILGPYMIPMNL